MNRILAVTVTMVALALATGTAFAEADDEQESAERLEDAQQRLEAAAREVAELSAEAGGVAAERAFEFRMLPPMRRAMLGVNLGGSEQGGIRVNGVSPGGPAAEAGVRTGDVIVAVQAKPVTTGRELVKVMEAVEPGEKVALELKRDGKPVKVAVEARPLENVFVARNGAVSGMPVIEGLPAMPPMAGRAFAEEPHWLLEEWGDAEFVSLTPGLGRYFGADSGVLVVRAPEDSTLGLQDGDVIVSIGDREPQNGRHAMRILRSYQPGEAVELKILRDRRAQSLRSTVPERVRPDVLRRRASPPAAPATPAAPTAPAPAAATPD